MSPDQKGTRVRVVCTECPFERVVPKGDGEPAAVIVEHGRDTGHKLTTEPVDRSR